MKTTIQKTTAGLLAGLLLALSLVTPAYAQEIFQGDAVPPGTILNQDVILFGQSVSIDGTVNGNVFILGNQVEVNGIVDGSLILIAQNAVIRGSVSGAVYATALTLDLASDSVLSRDLYAITVSLTSGKDSVIGRDLYAIGLDSGMYGQVGNDLHTTIGPIQLYNGLMTLLGFEELTLKLHFDLPQPPAPDENSTGNLHRPAASKISMRMVNAEVPQGYDWGKWGLDLARDFGVLLVLGLLALWLIRPRLEQAGQSLREKPLQTFGLGMLGLVIVINLLLVALLIAVLLFAIGLGLTYLGLGLLALLFWLVAYSILFFVAAVLWLFILYGTKIVAVYSLSRWIFDRFTPKQAFWVNALALLAGITLYALLRSIPYVGWIFGLIITALGLGSAWKARRARRMEAGMTPKKPARAKKQPSG